MDIYLLVLIDEIRESLSHETKQVWYIFIAYVLLLSKGIAYLLLVYDYQFILISLDLYFFSLQWQMRKCWKDSELLNEWLNGKDTKLSRLPQPILINSHRMCFSKLLLPNQWQILQIIMEIPNFLSSLSLKTFWISRLH